MEQRLQRFRQEVRGFARAQIAPRAAQIDLDNRFPPDLWQTLGAAGLHGITIPKELGGRGLDYLHHAIAMEEISRASGSIGLSYIAHSNICLDNLYRIGSREQRERYVPGLCSGELVGALALSEPEAGSDILGGMSASAVRDGDEWVINGSKTWITNGFDADVLIVYLRTADRSLGSNSITAFLLECGTPGFTAHVPMDKLGMRGSNTSTLEFSDCRIPAANVLGEVGGGARLMMQCLDTERIVLAAGPVGLMQAALDLVLPQLHARRQFGKAIGEFELIQAKLADLYAGLQAARAFVYDVASRYDGSRAMRKDAAACLMFAANAAMPAMLDTLQMLGGRGYLNESPAGRLLRDAKVYQIGGGTDEIRHIVIGRELFAGSRPEEDMPAVRQA
jgi:isovaleryl-CoA dehydrogenase